MDPEDIRNAVKKYIEGKKDSQVGINEIPSLRIAKGQNPKLIGELYYFVAKHRGRPFKITADKKFNDYFSDEDLLTIYKNIKDEKATSLSESTKNELLITMLRYAAILEYVVT